MEAFGGVGDFHSLSILRHAIKVAKATRLYLLLGITELPVIITIIYILMNLIFVIRSLGGQHG